jgi:hypothetical protein
MKSPNIEVDRPIHTSRKFRSRSGPGSGSLGTLRRMGWSLDFVSLDIKWLDVK